MASVAATYNYGLGFTSQFYHCSLPLRLDTYSNCSYGCQYCFAAMRGGQRRGRGLRVFDHAVLERHLASARSADGPTGVIAELLRMRQPIHLGGMSDPFVAAETRLGATKKVLSVLAQEDYPTIISTKGVDLIDEDHLALLAQGRFVVQISLSSLDDSLMESIDRRAPSPQRRLQAIRDLTAIGVPVSVRVQPIVPGREQDISEVVRAGAEAGAFHMSFEHLKLGVESNFSMEDFSQRVGIDVAKLFRQKGSERIGRKWVLPTGERLPLQLKLREEVRKAGMSFAAADNDLLLLSDGSACCSGTDRIEGFKGHFRFNYLEALRRGLVSGHVVLSALGDVPRPSGSIAREVNSHSRIRSEAGKGAGVEAYIRRNWDGRSNGMSPLSFWGVIESGEVSEDGSKVYGFDGEALTIYRKVVAGKSIVRQLQDLSKDGSEPTAAAASAETSE